MKIGARNRIEATVRNVKKGAVMAQVDVDVDGPIALSSVMTMDSLKEMKLRKGDKVRVVVKAIQVLLIKED